MAGMAGRSTRSLERMRTSRAANLAIVLAVLAWPLLVYAVLSQLADPMPSLSHAELEALRHRSILVLSCGVLAIVASLWLSGFAYQSARVRSIVAVGLCVVPTIAVLVSMV
jgi:hypothetical protein